MSVRSGMNRAPPIGAAILLITRTRDPHLVYEEVDWGLLVFFVGLFLIVGGAENAGLTRHLLGFGERFNLQHLGVFTLVTAILSNLVSNVPAVMLLKSLVSQFADTHSAWLTLAMASTLAGNLTITGSVANIIVVERAQKSRLLSNRPMAGEKPARNPASTNVATIPALSKVARSIRTAFRMRSVRTS